MQRITAKGRALRQMYKAAQNCSRPLFTSLTGTDAMTRSARHSAIGRGEAGWTGRPRAMMSSDSAGSSPYFGNEICIGHDVDFDRIKSHMTCSKFYDSTWGFVIYRCSQGHQSAWDRVLQALRSSVQDTLRYYNREELLQFHDLHVIDDKRLYGATSHQVREHFQSWVPKNLEDRLRPGASDLKDDIGWHYATSTPRYQYCLFADDICLESMDQPGFHMPVVKILCKDWESPWSPEEMSRPVPAPFHDGFTEDYEEDVGWMYMSLSGYDWNYHLLGKCYWDDLYVRPPYIDFSEDETNFVGYWRKKSSSEETNQADREGPLSTKQ
ncbi:hypothetical protein MKX08_002159 [Trichoderma sp. CBMAI-0020]|nr:hypothetical protein MKX08_002159 [Trichoderma sp. CBMAI-0020]WOD46525.1 hypothetical protein [Trichoderma atroviride]